MNNPAQLAPQILEFGELYFRSLKFDGDGNIRLGLFEKRTDRPLGRVELKNCRMHQRASVDNVEIVPEGRRQGIARRAIRVACAFAFRDLAVRKVTARIYDSNLPALRLFRSVGFTEEGLLRDHETSPGGLQTVHCLALFATPETLARVTPDEPNGQAPDQHQQSASELYRVIGHPGPRRPESSADASPGIRQLYRTRWTAEEITTVCGGRWINPPAESWVASGAEIHPSRVIPGDILFATTPDWGSKHYGDTHDKLATSAGPAAAVLIVQRVPASLPPNVPTLVVPDTLAAIIALGRAARARFKGKVACITGTVGKTTIKEALRFVLDQQSSAIGSTRNSNLTTGVAMALVQTPPDFAYGVYECAHGAMARKSQLAKPHVALISEIQADHMDSFDSLESIANHKALIFEGLLPGGAVVLNRDNPFYEHLARIARSKGIETIFGFGTDPKSTLRALDIELGPTGSRVRVEHFGQQIDFVLPSPGRHLVMNSLAVLAAVSALGADVVRAAASLADLPLVPGHGRQKTVNVHGGSIELFDGSYNSSPVAVRAALNQIDLVEPGPGGRRIAVLSDIGELGKDEARYHADLADPVLASKLDILFTIGPLMKNLRDRLPERLLAAPVDSFDDLVKNVISTLRPGDVVTIKGSARGGQMSRLVRSIEALGNQVPRTASQSGSAGAASV